MTPKRGGVCQLWCLEGNHVRFQDDVGGTIPDLSLVVYLETRENYHKVIYGDMVGWIRESSILFAPHDLEDD